MSDASFNSADLKTSTHSVPVALLLLAMPMIASMISRTAMSFVDFAMVSQLGTEAQAAIMPAGILLFCVISFGFALLSVVNAFVSQSLGRGELNNCGAYLWQGMWIGIVLGGVWLPTWWWVPDLFAWINHEPAVQRMEVAYVQIGILGMAPTLAVAALSNFFNGIHKPSVSFWAALIGNLINVLMNYVLIFGHWGFPRMGIAGAAWGTFIATVVQLILLMGWAGRPACDRVYHVWRAWKPDWPKMRAVLWYGVPSGVQLSMDILAFTIFTNKLVGQFGTVQLAANNISFKFLEIAFMPAVGLGTAVTAAVGKAIGQGDIPLARRVVRWGWAFGMTYMGLIGLSYVVAGRQLIDLLSDDQDVILWGSRILLLCAVYQVFDAMGIIGISALRGAGDNHYPAIVGVVLGVVVMIGGGYVLGRAFPQWQSLGPWTAAITYITLFGIFMLWRWRHDVWEKIDMFKDQANPMANS